MARFHGTAQAILPGFDTGGIEEEVGDRRRAEVKGKGAIGTNSNPGGDGDTGGDMSSTSVKFLYKTMNIGEPGILPLNHNTDLTEIHRLDTFTSQGWTDRRTGTSLSSSNNELDKLLFGKCAASHGEMVEMIEILWKREVRENSFGDAGVKIFGRPDWLRCQASLPYAQRHYTSLLSLSGLFVLEIRDSSFTLLHLNLTPIDFIPTIFRSDHLVHITHVRRVLPFTSELLDSGPASICPSPPFSLFLLLFNLHIIYHRQYELAQVHVCSVSSDPFTAFTDSIWAVSPRWWVPRSLSMAQRRSSR